MGYIVSMVTFLVLWALSFISMTKGNMEACLFLYITGTCFLKIALLEKKVQKLESKKIIRD
jgi:hypothetical protein